MPATAPVDKFESEFFVASVVAAVVVASVVVDTASAVPVEVADAVVDVDNVVYELGTVTLK